MPVAAIKERRTSADLAFEYLESGIQSLRLLPGSKISEAEIAAKLGLSRQPVREAFVRLDREGLLLVQPQKATIVRKFSLDRIATARFTRCALELEVLNEAVKHWDGSLLAEFEKNLAAQEATMHAQDIKQFHSLDLTFHQLICHAGKTAFAFDVIAETKTSVTRLCELSLTQPDEISLLIADHKELLAHMIAGDPIGAAKQMRCHLSRLDSTVQSIYEQHAHFFDDA